MRSLFTKAVIAALASAVSISQAGCGKQAFNQVEIQDLSQRPGHYEIPAKVDILVAQDDSSSMSGSFATIRTQIQSFLGSIENSGWDYHLAVTPLSYTRAIDQVAASRYDSNWGSNWLAPYPGALPQTPGMFVHPSAFRTSSNFSGFLTSSSGVTVEPGLKTIASVLEHSSAQATGFMREDALLVIFVISNGDDVSDYSPTCNSGAQGNSPACVDAKRVSYENLRSRLLGIKPSARQIKMYSAVSNYSSGVNGGYQCLQSNSFRGTRYMNMAADLGGTSFDLCNQPIGDAIAAFGENLHAERLSYRTRILFMSQAPNENREITVIKKFADGSETIIPQDPVNGWTYLGEVNNVPAIDYPVPMQYGSGYAIRLNGTSALVGDETATLSYYVAGGEDSVEE